jgi:hypothetical protein
MSLFWYKRKITTKKEVEEEVEGELKKVSKDITTIYWDFFNIDCVVRGLWKDDKTFSVLLNDGHEQAEDRQKPVFNAKGGIRSYETKRERDWFYSQIDLDKEDAQRLWSGKNHPGTSDL